MPQTVTPFIRFLVAVGSALCCIVLTACNATMPKLQVANFQATSADLVGQWTGTYTCAQGLTGVRLSLAATGDKTVAGTFEFFPTAANAKVTQGSFAVTGTISRPGRLELMPGAWIVRPSGYMPVRVAAAVFSDPDKISGTVTDAGCGRFEAERVSTTSAVAALSSAPFAGPAPARAGFGSAAPLAEAPSVATAAGAKPVRDALPPFASSAVTHAQFVALLGKEKLSKLVGTTLALNLKRGGDGGWKGYIEDQQSMVFFTCQSAAKSYGGGATVSKIKSLRSADNGVFVVLERCETTGATK